MKELAKKTKLTWQTLEEATTENTLTFSGVPPMSVSQILLTQSSQQLLSASNRASNRPSSITATSQVRVQEKSLS